MFNKSVNALRKPAIRLLLYGHNAGKQTERRVNDQLGNLTTFIIILTNCMIEFSLEGKEIQLFRERLSGKLHATVLKGIVGGFEFSFFQRNLKELVRKAMGMCLRVLKESNRSRFDSYSRQEQCIDHIPYYLSGLSRAHFFRQPFSK